MMTTIRRPLLLSLPFLLVLTACSEPEPGPPTAAEPSSEDKSGDGVRVSAPIRPGTVCFIDWAIAREKGFFAAEGLDMKFGALDTSRGTILALAAPDGPIDAEMGIVEYPELDDLASGELDYYVMAGEHSGCKQLVVPVDSLVESIADLKGKRVGINTTNDVLMWEFFARQAGLMRDDLVFVPHDFPPGSPEAVEHLRREFAAGRLDAAIDSDPVGKILLAEGAARPLVSNTHTAPLSNMSCCMLAVWRNVPDQHPGGIPAALIASMVKTAAAVQRQVADRPAEVIAGINRHLCEQAGGVLVTAAYLYVDLERGRLWHASAGHPPPLLLRAWAARPVSVGRSGMVAGVLADAPYETIEETLAAGDRVILYTDGVIEATALSGDFFDPARLEAALTEGRDLAPDAWSEDLLDRLKAWTGKSTLKHDDDFTVVVLDRV